MRSYVCYIFVKSSGDVKTYLIMCTFDDCNPNLCLFEFYLGGLDNKKVKLFARVQGLLGYAH